MKTTNPEDPYLIVTSDTHVSSAEGRWSEATAHFRSFLDSLKANPPQIVFINGDIIDNFTPRVVRGTLPHWEKDVHEYLSLKAKCEGIDFQGSLGNGHDFTDEISMEYAGGKLCHPRGSFCWQGFDFVWLSGKVSTFSNEPAARVESFDADDLLWLDNELASKEKVVLLFHVPLRTDDTVERGEWKNNSNLTTPREDKIYAVIDKHLGRIETIFNGHIHHFIESEYKGIPIYISPFYGKGHHCKISVHADELNVTVHTYPAAG